MPDTVRCFVAIEIDEQIREGTRDLVSSLSSLPTKVGWVRPENMHLTIRFLGEQAREKLQSISEALSKAGEGIKPFKLSYGKLGVFPPRGAPRTIWVGVDGEMKTLQLFHQRLSDEFLKLQIKKEKRRFSPHLTIGRVRGKITFSQWQKVSKGMEKIFLGDTLVKKALLIQSELLPGKPPRYTCLSTVTFGESS